MFNPDKIKKGAKKAALGIGGALVAAGVFDAESTQAAPLTPNEINPDKKMTINEGDGYEENWFEDVGGTGPDPEDNLEGEDTFEDLQESANKYLNRMHEKMTSGEEGYTSFIQILTDEIENTLGGNKGIGPDVSEKTWDADYVEEMVYTRACALVVLYASTTKKYEQEEYSRLLGLLSKKMNRGTAKKVLEDVQDGIDTFNEIAEQADKKRDRKAGKANADLGEQAKKVIQNNIFDQI